LIQARYIMWQYAAYRAAQRIIELEEIDLVHHVSWTTMTGPTLAWKLGKPFVWGSVGSGQQAPLQMRRYLGTKGWLREAVRNLQVKSVIFNPLARAAARYSSVAIASNPDTLAKLKQLGADPVILQPDAAVGREWLALAPPAARDRDRLVIAWASRLMPRKAPRLAVEAFARLRQEHDAELWFIGDGPLISECRELAAQLGVERDVRFLGWVPHGQVKRILADADIFLFTSLRDTCPMPAIEAMAWGLPVVARDLHGVRNFSDDVILKVPVGKPEHLVDDVAAALKQLAGSRELRAERATAAWECARTGHLWEHRSEGVAKAYEMVLGRPPLLVEWEEDCGRAAD
jgi:glycosyltransferase involved in cell wall biosynthesis